MRELIIDNFAGGGGVSFGIEAALGRSPDYAINHNWSALYMHRQNHPCTETICEDVFKVSPVKLCAGRPVALAWFSPDCKHFSKAKGGKPVDKRIRGLAWVAVRWAREVGPRVIILENVEEFLDWGPLGEDGRPNKERKGWTFKRFVGCLKAVGYRVEWRMLIAADYGSPTTRKRFFLIARNDGRPIVWPVPTHRDPRRGAELFDGNLPTWRTAAECIDWSIPCPSIFDRPRPLAEATLRRIARGLQKFVIEHPNPFIVSYYGEKRPGDFRGQDLQTPLRTQTTENRFGLIVPYLSRQFGESTGQHVESPVPTVMPGGQGKTALVAPYLAKIGQTGSTGSRTSTVEEPLRTVVSKNEDLLVTPYLIPRYTEGNGQQPRCRSVEEPLPVVVPTGNGAQLVQASFIAKHYTGVTGHVPDKPLGTVTTIDHHSLCAAFLTKFSRTGDGSDMRLPVQTVTAAAGKFAQVQAFLIKYYGAGTGQDCREPLHTVPTKDRFGLVTVHGEEYQIVDIGMRMLSPRELARAHGFPETCWLPKSKTLAVRLIGNSVPIHPVCALVQANLPELLEREEVAVA